MEKLVGLFFVNMHRGILATELKIVEGFSFLMKRNVS